MTGIDLTAAKLLVAEHPRDCPDSGCRHPQCCDPQPEDVGYTLARPAGEDDGLFGPGGYPIPERWSE